MHHLTFGINSLLHSVNLIVFTLLLVHRIVYSIVFPVQFGPPSRMWNLWHWHLFVFVPSLYTVFSVFDSVC